MRRALVFVALIGAQAALTARADEEFPYTAYVQSNDVFIRSGPGASYYATDKLRRGDTVEVYRLDAGGWYAIRPPRDSFSWVASRHVKLTESKLGEVTGDGVVVRVGSNLSDLRDVTQVRLDQGEEVEVVNAPRDRDGTPTDAWWKITPPSGEFRWISQRDISKDPPAREVPPSINESTDHAGKSADRTGTNSDARFETSRDTNTSGKSADFKDAPGDRTNGRQTGGWTPAGERDASSGSSSGSPPSMFTADAFRRELVDIDLTLSTIVAKDCGTWRFEDLFARCDEASKRAPTPADQAMVRELHAKITKFDDLARRHKTIQERIAGRNKDTTPIAPRTALTPAPSATKGPALGTASGAAPLTAPVVSVPSTPESTSTIGAKTDDKRPDASNFDGIGRLTRVVSKKTGSPTFALVSPTGEIVTFVTPAPGVSLYGYAGQEVGLNGQRGFSTELNKPHLTASRVTVIK